MEMPTKIPLLPYMNAYISGKVIFDCCLIGYPEAKPCSKRRKYDSMIYHMSERAEWYTGGAILMSFCVPKQQPLKT